MQKLQIKVQSFLIVAILFLLPFYFVKFKYRWISLNIVEVLIIALFIFWIFSKNIRYRISTAKYTMPVVLIFVGLLLSIAANENLYSGFGALKGWFILPIIFSVIFLSSLKKNENFLSWALYTIYFSGALISAAGIYYFFRGWLTYDGRLSLFYDSPNQLAMMLAPAFLIGLKLGFEELRELGSRKGKAELWKNGICRFSLIAFSIVLISFSLYLTKSFGAWTSLAAVLFIMFMFMAENWRKRAYISAVLLLLVGLAIFSQQDKIVGTRIFGERSSLSSRVMIWKSAGLMIRDNPFFGIGPGNFQNKYLEYQKYFPPYLEWAVPQPHNLYLAFWLEAGLLGFAGFLLLLARFFQDNKKAKKNDRLDGLLCLAIILYFLIHGLIDTTYWKNDSAVIFWVVVVINIFLASSSSKNKIENPTTTKI